MTLRPRLIVFASLVLCAACPGPSGGDGGAGGGTAGGGAGGGGGGTGGPVPFDELCDRLQTGLCGVLDRCGAFSDAGNCDMFLGGSSCAAQQVSSIDAGRVRYDGAQAATCLASLSSATCDLAVLNGSPACDLTFVGLVPSGGVCANDGECAGGHFCRGNMLACGGICTAKIAVGQPVTFGETCVDGAVRFNGVCSLPVGGRGTPCDNPDGGFDTLPCAEPSFCASYTQADGGRTRACGVSDGVAGGVCSDRDAGVSGCGGFTNCDTMTNRCLALAGVGATCPARQFGSTCKVDLWCNGGVAPATCQPLSATGGPCVSDSSCRDGVCNGGSFSTDGGLWTLGSCGAAPQLNQACRDRCAAGLYCDQGLQTCQTLKADRTACGGGDECASGECNTLDGGPSSCGPCR